MLQIAPCIELLKLADGAGVSSHPWNCVQEEQHLVPDLDFNSSQLGKVSNLLVLSPASVPVVGAQPAPLTPSLKPFSGRRKGYFPAVTCAGVCPGVCSWQNNLFLDLCALQLPTAVEGWIFLASPFLLWHLVEK